ncbi:major facilitator superfamily domain-containing protein 6 [Caerostris extrusa]|uniref:Major facilitator superfamily domain-containing protein 6 n=1 Tax=Caerostris extrusa TaxID=172846 RepID=A0AAV4WHN9_CAEEX|nr:major facilitator superfamily domain-containing protein 6 [Caerostris extrusa]
MVLKPLFGAIADYFDNLKALMVVFMMVIMLSSSLTLSIPRKENMISSDIKCAATGTTLYFKSKPSQECMVDVLVSKPLKCYMYCEECTEFQPQSNSSDKACIKKKMHPVELTVNLEEQNGSTHFFNVKNMTLADRKMNTLCFVNVTFACSSYCEPVLQECFTGKQQPEYNSDQFWLFLIFGTMTISLSGVCSSFSDAICFNELGENGHLYGKQRLWGTIGWGLLSPVAGYINDLVTGDSFLKAYQPGAILLLSLIFLDGRAVCRLKTKNLKCSQNVCKDISIFIKQFKVLAFLLSVLMVGSFTALLWSFLYWHLLNLGATKIILGVVPAVQCFLGELVFFFFSGKLISKFGHFNILILNFFVFGVRFIAYSYLTHPWLVLPIELLQGPTYGLFYATMASFAHSAAFLPGTEVTVQGLVGSGFELGMVAGNLIGGMSMQMYDGAFTFFWAGVVSFGYCLVHTVFTIIVKVLEKEHKDSKI